MRPYLAFHVPGTRLIVGVGRIYVEGRLEAHRTWGLGRVRHYWLVVGFGWGVHVIRFTGLRNPAASGES